MAAPWPTLSYSCRDSLANPMLITVFELFWPKAHWEPCNVVGSLSPVELLVRFEQVTWFLSQRLNPLGQLLAFPNFSGNFYFPYWSTVNFRVLWTHSGQTHFWPRSPLIDFNQLLIFINLYQHAKNKTFSWHCSGDIVDSKIGQSIWPRAFWPISGTRFSPKYGICTRIQQIK